MSTARSKRVAIALTAVVSLGALSACDPAQRANLTAALGASRPGPAAPAATPAGPVELVTLPATAATQDSLSVSAAEALWALWYDDPSYPEALGRVIPVVAQRAKVSAAAVEAAWYTAGRERMIAVLSALTQVGVPYKRYKSVVGVGFDCSGLTSWAWRQAGVSLSRSSARQIRQVRQVELATALPGDLLYYPGHISMAVGVDNAIIHAPYTGAKVEVRPMFTRRVNALRAGTPI